jgi:hypothetical protein
VYDGFYPEPDVIRREALALEYGRLEFDAYPGRNSTNHVMQGGVVDAIGRIVNATIIVNNPKEFGLFRLSFLGDPGESFIHFDPAGWAGIVYLNEPAHCAGGTALWRHRATGLEQFPFESWANYGFPSQLEAWKSMVRVDGNDVGKWDLVQFVPARYNRLLLFNSQLFHSHMPRQNFGTSIETARLIQVFFLPNLTR